MSSPTYNLSPTYNASPSYDFSHSFNSFPAYNIVKRNFKSQAHNMGYVVPTRNASILGYGGRRTDGQFSERRKPSATQLPNAAIRAEARAIPNGDGENLTDRQRMILCYLNGEERHRKYSFSIAQPFRELVWIHLGYLRKHAFVAPKILLTDSRACIQGIQQPRRVL
jgi:hypothetical protein